MLHLGESEELEVVELRSLVLTSGYTRMRRFCIGFMWEQLCIVCEPFVLLK